MAKSRTYIAIDLKSFYASVECMERGLNPMTTNLVVADGSRTDKTICLAVSPSLKSFGIPGRPRLFEVVQKVKIANAHRLSNLNYSKSYKESSKKFIGSSFDINELKENSNLSIDYITAPPQMAYYLDYSTKIYEVYLKYVSSEDIQVYSIDEVFIDVTDYLKTYEMSAFQLTKTIIDDVLNTMGITATAGIGTNLYLAKIAMDIMAKKQKPDKNGASIAYLDEMLYRKELWNHRPLTDFWRIGKGYTKKLEKHGLYTIGDIARCSIGKSNEYHNEDLLYELFGVNAELLIDHAWGIEPCTISDIKKYKPLTKSINSGQVLHEPYTFQKAEIVLREMLESLSLDLLSKKVGTNQIVLTIGYDIENLSNPEMAKNYTGEITIDPYGRKVPKHAHGTTNLKSHTSSSSLITQSALTLYKEIVDSSLLIRKITISANKLQYENDYTSAPKSESEQLSFFVDYDALEEDKKNEAIQLAEERSIQNAMLEIKNKYGKNSILKGTSLQKGATAKNRNNQIGGHKA